MKPAISNRKKNAFMAQEENFTALVPWRPTPTLIPAQWQTYLEELGHKAKGPHYIAGLSYDRQGTSNLLREWGLPLPVVVAGGLLFYTEKELRHIAADERRELLAHMRSAQRYIGCIAVSYTHLTLPTNREV